ncbi:MFS transporter [Sphingomonas sp. TX0543]|uniref:MFS transporter n=1 Tax=unclassified Sphingomonas TaxID=196159 RepID=UPI0010F6BB90|nr:MFS transporter [Sphingomonas sp. 3P27F8]
MRRIIVIISRGCIIQVSDHGAIADGKYDAPSHSIALLAAAMVFGASAFVVLSLGPVVFSAMVSAGRLTNEAIGRAATCELAALALGAAIGPRFLRHSHLRAKALGSAVLLIAANMLCYRANSPPPIYLLRSLCGLAEGGLLSASMLVLTYVPNPERMNAYFLGISAVPQAILAYIVPIAIDRYGANFGFGAMAALAVISGLLTLYLPASFGPLPDFVPKTLRTKWTPAIIIAISCTFLQFSAVGAAWSYAAQVAEQYGMSSTTIGTALASNQIFCVAAGLIVGAIGWRVHYTPALIVTCAAMAALSVLFALNRTPVFFVLACSLYGLAWIGGQPFNLKMFVALDPARNVALYAQPVMLAALGAGPYVASYLVTSHDVTPAFWWSMIAFIVSGVIYAGAHFLRPAPWAGATDG